MKRPSPAAFRIAQTLPCEAADVQFVIDHFGEEKAEQLFTKHGIRALDAPGLDRLTKNLRTDHELILR